jgi:single-strand DNA-binding protein
MNKYIATGNLVREVEMTYTGGGLAIFKNCIAVKDTFKKDTTYFHNFTAFGKTAETMANFLHKGSKVLIEGQLTQSSYEKDGQKRTSTDVIVDRFEFLDSKKDGAENGQTSQSNTRSSNQPSDPFNSHSEPYSINSDDLPF